MKKASNRNWQSVRLAWDFVLCVSRMAIDGGTGVRGNKTTRLNINEVVTNEVDHGRASAR